MTGFAHTSTLVAFDSMTPGEAYELSAEFHFGVHGSGSINYGTGAQPASDTGTVLFLIETHALTQGHQGTARFWLRPEGTDQDAPPVNDIHGKPALLVGKHLP